MARSVLSFSRRARAPRLLPVLCVAMAFAGCADDAELSVDGSALLTVPGEAVTGFEFAERIRLAEALEVAPAGAVAGTCEVQGEADERALFVALEVPPGTALEGIAMRRFALRVPLVAESASPAELQLTLAEETVTAATSEDCAIGLVYQTGSEAGVTVDCAVETSRGVGDVDAELFYSGCR